MNKKSFLAKQVDKVKAGSGVDLQHLARNPGQFIQGRREARESRTRHRVPAARGVALFKDEDVYETVHGLPERLRDLSRSDSLPIDRSRVEDPPSPPRSLPPKRRVFGLDSVSSCASSVDEVFGSASDLQPLYIEMSVTHTVAAAAAAETVEAESWPGVADDTEVHIHRRHQSDGQATGSPDSSAGGQTFQATFAMMEAEQEQHMHLIDTVNDLMSRNGLVERFPMSVVVYGNLSEEIQNQVLSETGCASKSGLLDRGVITINQLPTTSTPSAGSGRGLPNFHLSTMRAADTPRRGGAQDQTYTRAAGATAVRFAGAGAKPSGATSGAGFSRARQILTREVTSQDPSLVWAENGTQLGHTREAHSQATEMTRELAGVVLQGPTNLQRPLADLEQRVSAVEVEEIHQQVLTNLYRLEEARETDGGQFPSEEEVQNLYGILFMFAGLICQQDRGCCHVNVADKHNPLYRDLKSLATELAPLVTLYPEYDRVIQYYHDISPGDWCSRSRPVPSRPGEGDRSYGGQLDGVLESLGHTARAPQGNTAAGTRPAAQGTPVPNPADPSMGPPGPAPAPSGAGGPSVPLNPGGMLVPAGGAAPPPVGGAPPPPGGGGGQPGGGGGGAPGGGPPGAGGPPGPVGPPGPGNQALRAQEAFYMTMINRLNAAQARPAPAGPPPNIRDQEARMREHMGYLHWYTGQKASDKRGCHAKVDLVEEDIDKWLGYFATFQRSCQVPPALHRRAFFGRLSGNAFKHLHPYYNRLDIDLPQLSAMLRVRFLPTRTLDDVLRAKKEFTNYDSEKLASYVDRYNELLVKQAELDRHFNEGMRVYQLWSKFWSILGQNCRERLELGGLDDPLRLSEALLRAQEFYIHRGESPWPQKRKPREGKTKIEINAAKATDKCNVCSGLGHWARDCLKAGDLPSYQTKSKQAAKTSETSAGKCHYCQRDHPSSDCYQAKALMRQAGFVTSGKGGTQSNSKKKASDSKKPEVPKGGGRGKSQRGRGKAKGREKVHTAVVEPEGTSEESPDHPCGFDGHESEEEQPQNFQ